MKSYKVHENQNLFDVASHIYGDASAAILLAKINNLSLTDGLVCGQEIILGAAPIQSNIVKVITTRNIIPATTTAIHPLTGFRYELQLPL